MTSTLEAPDAPPALSRRRTDIVFVTIVLGMLMAALDQTIVSTALPTIVAELGGAGHMAWVVTAYMLTEVVATVLAGKFGDIFGRKLMFQLGAVLFVAGSVAGLSQDMFLLIVGRAIQGVGGGGLMVTAMALIADVIPLRERGKYQGAMGAVFGVTTVLGPTLGGLFLGSAILLAAFVRVESRAAEPMLPMSLVDRFRKVWRGWLDDQLEDWTFADPADRALLDQALGSIAGKLLDDRRNHLAAHA